MLQIRLVRDPSMRCRIVPRDRAVVLASSSTPFRRRGFVRRRVLAGETSVMPVRKRRNDLTVRHRPLPPTEFGRPRETFVQPRTLLMHKVLRWGAAQGIVVGIGATEAAARPADPITFCRSYANAAVNVSRATMTGVRISFRSRRRVHQPEPI